MKGRDAVLVVGDDGPSSKSVSIARSSAPVDFAIVRDEYDEPAVDVDRLRWGMGGGDVVADEEEEAEEYLDSLLVMDGKRTLLPLPATAAGFAGVARGSGLARSGRSSSSSSSEFAYARPP